MKPPQAMDVEGQQVVLHESPILRLILADDTEVSILQPSRKLNRFASLHVLRAFRLDDLHGNLQPRYAIDATLTTVVMFVVGVQSDDLVTEETCRLRASVSNQGFPFGQFQFEVV